MLKVAKVHAACNVARFYGISHVKGVERNKNMHSRLDLTHLFMMSKVLYTIYIDTSNGTHVAGVKLHLIHIELQQTSK